MISTAGRLLQKVHDSADLAPREIAHALGVDAAEIVAAKSFHTTAPATGTDAAAAAAALNQAFAKAATELVPWAVEAIKIAPPAPTPPAEEQAMPPEPAPPAEGEAMPSEPASPAPQPPG